MCKRLWPPPARNALFGPYAGHAALAQLVKECLHHRTTRVRILLWPHFTFGWLFHFTTALSPWARATRRPGKLFLNRFGHTVPQEDRCRNAPLHFSPARARATNRLGKRSLNRFAHTVPKEDRCTNGPLHFPPARARACAQQAVREKLSPTRWGHTVPVCVAERKKKPSRKLTPALRAGDKFRRKYYIFSTKYIGKKTKLTLTFCQLKIVCVCVCFAEPPYGFRTIFPELMP